MLLFVVLEKAHSEPHLGWGQNNFFGRAKNKFEGNCPLSPPWLRACYGERSGIKRASRNYVTVRYMQFELYFGFCVVGLPFFYKLFGWSNCLHGLLKCLRIFRVYRLSLLFFRNISFSILLFTNFCLFPYYRLSWLLAKLLHCPRRMYVL